MRLFIKSSDYLLWDEVIDAQIIPMNRVKDQLIEKERQEWTNGDYRRLQLNDKAMHILFCALGLDEYAKSSYCSSAKEICDKFEKIAIIKAKNLKTLNLDELMRSFLTHQLMRQDKNDEEKNNEVENNVGIALKTSHRESDSNEDEDDEGMTMLAMWFTRKKKKKMLKTHVVTLRDEDSSYEEEQEVANICLMARIVR
ncbi:hypothetical protein GQ457_03G025370 [Hibiscus cannabinus]